jgi:hypothetical protein
MPNNGFLPNKKALGLFSAGLDSWLSALLIKQQGFDVHLLHFVSPLFGYKGEKLNKIKRMVEEKGMTLIVYNVGDDYVEDVVKRPQHGIGSALNSCIDCHRYMLQKAKIIMENIKAEFIFSGEVIGQRPMSQRKEALDIVENESALRGLLLRPLSAKLMPETLVEKKGIVDRSRLLAIYGRGRSQQFALAKEFGLNRFPQPSGGCKFTDKNIRSRFISIREISKNIDWQDLELVIMGRHFNLGDGYYLVLARDLGECQRLLNYRNKGSFVEARNMGGAKGILIHYGTTLCKEEDEKYLIAASIIARYTKIPDEHDGPIDIIFYEFNGKERNIGVKAIEEEQLKKYLVV